MDHNFWNGKRVFVTGHTGFKGGWLCLWLQQLGAQVTGFALPPSTSPSLFDVARVSSGMESIFGDIRDFAQLSDELRKAGPDIVIHMAAQPLVRYSYANPVETYATNVMGTVHLLEAVRACDSVRAVVVVTSDKCYENREWVWGYRENEPMGGYDPYSNSKGCAELVTAAYRSSYFNSQAFDRHRVAVATARAGNVIGGGDWAADRLIPDMIRAIDRGEPVRIRNPLAIRPWQHVMEPLSGYLLLAEMLYLHGSRHAEAWNFGPEDSDARPVQWIVEKLTSAWGEGASWMRDASPQPHEATFLKLDCSKAKSALQWSPRWGLDEAITRIAEWYKAFAMHKDMHAITLSQIDAYQNTLIRDTHDQRSAS